MKKHLSEKRLYAAIVIAPILVSILVTIANSIAFRNGAMPLHLLDGIGLGLGFSYPSIILFGLPIHLTFRSFNRDRYFWYGMAGFVLGFIIPKLIFWTDPFPLIIFLGWGALPGALIALLARGIVGPAPGIVHEKCLSNSTIGS
ncbi:MAG: hypothetical protein GY761_03075 [Hyphomicrobiales bacterium]|nr:hypothetical protein [Hyphomicrobiales bacterium]